MFKGFRKKKPVRLGKIDYIRKIAYYQGETVSYVKNGDINESREYTIELCLCRGRRKHKIKYLKKAELVSILEELETNTFKREVN